MGASGGTEGHKASDITNIDFSQATVTNLAISSLGLTKTRVDGNRLEVVAGTPTPSRFVSVGGVLETNLTAVGNVGAGEDTLMSYPLAENVLDENEASLEIEMHFSIAANANAKRVRVYWGTAVALDTTALASSGSDLIVRVTIVRIASGSQFRLAESQSTSTLFTDQISQGADSEDEESVIVIKATAEAVADNDVVQRLLRVKYFPAPPQ